MNYSPEFIEFCAVLNLKLTSLRKEVLNILWQAEKPLKAYEILGLLLMTKPNSKPPSVYRALEYFVGQGIAHKVESIQSYTLCFEPEKHLVSEVLMVCDVCHHVKEIHDESVQGLISSIAQKHHFTLHHDAIELKGLCDNCSQSSP